MVALGTAGSGREEVLGFQLGPSESAEGWGKCLESLTVTDCISKIWSSTWDSFEHLDDIIEGYFDYDIDYIFCCDY